MTLSGVLATLGHQLFATAYRAAPAALFAPANYLHLVWAAAALGWLIFGYLQDGISQLGLALVCASGMAIASCARRGQL